MLGLQEAARRHRWGKHPEVFPAHWTAHAEARGEKSPAEVGLLRGRRSRPSLGGLGTTTSCTVLCNSLMMPLFLGERTQAKPLVHVARERLVADQLDGSRIDLSLQRRVPHPNRSHAAQ